MAVQTFHKLVSAAVAAVLVAPFADGSASAAPGASSHVAAGRAFALQQGSGFDRIEIQLVQRRGSVQASSGPAAATDGDGWTACVFGWTSSSFFSDCSEPTLLTSTVAEGSATGRLRFEVQDDFWGDTALVDLTLRDKGGAPTVAVAAQPYADQLRVSSAPYATISRAAAVSGSVVVVTKRGQKRTAKRYDIERKTGLQVREAVSASASGGL